MLHWCCSIITRHSTLQKILASTLYSHWAGSVHCVQQCVGVLSCKLLSWEQLPTILYGESVRAKGTQPDGMANQNN